MLTSRHALVLLLIGSVGVPLLSLGQLFKLPYWPSTDLLGLVAGTLKFAAVATLVLHVFRHPAFKDFLDR